MTSVQRPTTARPRTALVLGGGGIVGGAWMVGALDAIATETGWDPAGADYLVGTSAGSMVVAWLAAGRAPSALVAQAMDTTSAAGEVEGRVGSKLQVQWSFPRPVLGSPALALKSLREPWRYGPAGIIAWLPRGVISTEPLKEAVRQVVPSGWASRENVWLVATDYASGERVVFGRKGAPVTDLADAVAASCAIPGFYFPVTIAGRRYVDGGVGSPSNLDVLLDTDVDLVVCLNPMSSAEGGGLLTPAGRLASVVRGRIGRQLAREAEALRRAGKRVVVVQPGADDLAVMGMNYMSGKRRNEVIAKSRVSTSELLRHTGLGRMLRQLAPSKAA